MKIQAQRAKRTPIELATAGAKFAQHDWDALATGPIVACYASWDVEPSTTELRVSLAHQGKQVYLPIIQPGNQMAWGLDQPPYSQNGFGISEPAISEFDLGTANAIILPAMCADETGMRLGRGAGYFDRAMANIPTYQAGGPIRIALLFDDEILPQVPSEEFDAGVDLIVTPTRVVTCTHNLGLQR